MIFEIASIIDGYLDDEVMDQISNGNILNSLLLSLISSKYGLTD